MTESGDQPRADETADTDLSSTNALFGSGWYVEKALGGFTRSKLKSWLRWSIFWRVLHYALGLIGIGSAVAIPIFRHASDATTTALAVTAGISTAFVTFLRPDKKAGAYWRAWLMMERERRLLAMDKSNKTKLLNAWEAAEILIAREVLGDTSESPPRKLPKTGVKLIDEN